MDADVLHLCQQDDLAGIRVRGQQRVEASAVGEPSKSAGVTTVSSGGLEITGSVGVVAATTPIRVPFSVETTVLPAIWPAISTTACPSAATRPESEGSAESSILPERYGKAAASKAAVPSSARPRRMFAMAVLPLSNSWLPKAMACTPSRFWISSSAAPPCP
ncbi:hypothetical protein [Mangrovicoccus sp. HB161399]|uniref:hypothetical protein n=1 Tax=Mangrovicoccus sp. HB161399 TaxID=2720392 RepID=UPI001C12EA9D|nr:hypothetical protein [Mangrovicoccus sp. HB161399]